MQVVGIVHPNRGCQHEGSRRAGADERQDNTAPDFVRNVPISASLPMTAIMSGCR